MTRGIALLRIVLMPCRDGSLDCQHSFDSICWAMLQEAKKRGYAQAYVWSSPLGKGVYRSVGFVPIEMGMCEYE